MKLLTRYSRINVLATIVIFLIAAGAFYLSLNYVLVRQIDDDLRIEEDEITTFVREHNKRPESISTGDQIIGYQAVNGPVKRHFTTNSFARPDEHHSEEFRQLVFGIHPAGQWFQVTVSKSLEDTDALIHSVLVISLITIIAIFIVSFIINRILLKRIWRPFYQSLDAVRAFKVGGDAPLQLQQTTTDEFAFMNRTLERITQQAQLDYLSLKTFSENASHEIQTPIAIIRSKLDLLIQDEHLTEEQSRAVQSAYNAIQKLVKLNHSLLLLAKIENKQFDEASRFPMKQKLKEKLRDFQELWQSQQITVTHALGEADVRMNTELADILLNNLLSNATRHNFPGGSIDIRLDAQQLSVSNTAQGGEIGRQGLFQRFYKSSQSGGSNGLGLSIVREICEASGFTIDYAFHQGMHIFTIYFTKQAESTI